MLKHFLSTRAAVCLLASTLLTACGGGGSSPATGGSNGPSTAAALTFSPGIATASMPSGTSTTVAVSASVNRPADFNSTVYAKIVDTTGVLLPSANIVSQTATQYTAVLQTNAALQPGNYKGNFAINLCRDQACSQHFPGSPMQLPYDFTVVAAAAKLLAQAGGSLTPTINLGAAAPSPVTVTVQAGQLKWTAVTAIPWLTLKNASGSGNGSFTVEFDSSKATEGVQSGAITVASTDGQQVTLNASLTTIARNFTVGQSGFTFTAINGVPINTQQVSFDLDGGGSWTASSDAAWLTATPTSGILPGQLGLTVDPMKGALASGQYNGNLTLKSPNGKDRSLSVQLNLIKPDFHVPSSPIYLGGENGREARMVQVILQTNTKGVSWPWTLGALPPWINVSARSGFANETGTSFEITPVLEKAPPGSSTAVVNVTLQVNGDTIVKPITLTILRDQEKILPSETGLAMVSVPGWSRLIRTVTVRDNFGANPDWTASSDQAWLNVIRNGSQLTFTGDPSSLPNDTTSHATVTLTSNTAGVAAPEVIRVALWKGSAAPAARVDFQTAYKQVIADAIRPLVYAHNGGNVLDVYNVYTGQKVASTALSGALGSMTVNQNGDRLYVYDMANRNVVMLNPQTLAKVGTWTPRNDLADFGHLLSVRPNGEELLLTSKGDVLRIANAQTLSAQSQLGEMFMAATRDGKRLYVQNQGASPSTAMVYDIDFTSVAGGGLRMTYAGSFSGGQNSQDIAPGLDGSRFYTANGWPYRCAIGDAVNFGNLGTLPGGDSYPNNVEVDSFGRVYCGAASWSAFDVWLHDSSGVQLKQFKFAGNGHDLKPHSLVVSADGMMLIGLTNDPLMSIMAVGP